LSIPQKVSESIRGIFDANIHKYAKLEGKKDLYLDREVQEGLHGDNDVVDLLIAHILVIIEESMERLKQDALNANMAAWLIQNPQKMFTKGRWRYRKDNKRVFNNYCLLSKSFFLYFIFFFF
jgi:hypothetical protein